MTGRGSLGFSVLFCPFKNLWVTRDKGRFPPWTLVPVGPPWLLGSSLATANGICQFSKALNSLGAQDPAAQPGRIWTGL